MLVGWLIRQMSISQKSGRKTFRRGFVLSSVFVSPCPPECYYKAKRKWSLISGYYRGQKWSDYEVKGPALPRSSPRGVWGPGVLNDWYIMCIIFCFDLLSLPSFVPDLFLEIRPLIRWLNVCLLETK